MVPDPDNESWLDITKHQGGISRMTPPELASELQSLPPILHMQDPNPMPSCSKAPRGLFVLLRTDGIFTVNALSPSSSSRQYPYDYSIRAGQNLPDKEFRSYMLLLLLLTINAIQFLV